MLASFEQNIASSVHKKRRSLFTIYLTIPKVRCLEDSFANLLVIPVGHIHVFDNDHFISVLSYNQPGICSSAMWDPNGITFGHSGISGSQPSNVFIDVTNAIYVSSQILFSVRMWSAEDDIPRRDLSAPFDNVSSVFVTGNGDIYASSGIDGEIVKWELNATNSTSILIASSICYSIFVDINNTLYCSIESQHQLVKYFLDDNNNNNNVSVIVAGNGSPGSGSDMLSSPKGVFVSTSFKVYVADCGNNRIQLVEHGASSAITIAGNGGSAVIALRCPTAVILDADNYLFIADGHHHRIVADGPNGFQCIIGCTGIAGSASNQLNYPQSLAFDSLRNLFVVDKNNDRIQKFVFIVGSCSKYCTKDSLNKNT